MADYLTRAEAAAWTGVSSSANVEMLDDIITECSRQIDDYCGRHFDQDGTTEDPVARYFEVEDPCELDLGTFNDLVSVDALEVDTNGDGTYDTEITNYILCPVGAATKRPYPMPYTEIELLNGTYFPTGVTTGREALIRVTGVWGWPEVPIKIKQACRLLVAEGLKLKDAPFGVTGNDITGIQYAPRDMPAGVKRLLAPLVHPEHVGIA